MDKFHKPVVAAVAADDYGEKTVNTAMQRLFSLLGDICPSFDSGQKVVIKPNLLMAAEPDKAITSHPAVVSALASECTSSGAEVKIVDSPGSGTPWNENSLRKLYDKCGMSRLARENVELNFDTSLRKVDFPNGRLVKNFELIEAALDCDTLVSVAKAKTHTFMIMTAAVKNLFGLVPGFDKPGWHARMKTPVNFGEMLVDLAELTKPALTIIDGIVGMEGDGPTSGSPRKLGFLLASTDIYALDVVLARVMGIDPMIVPTIAAAKKRGLTSASFSDIEIIGDSDVLRPVENFVPPRTVGGTGFAGAGRLASFLEPVISSMLVLTPVPKKSLCVGCGACVDACPNVAIAIEKGKAKISRDQCIRCYCCHEICPHEAMKLKRSFLYSIFRRFTR